MEYSLIMIKPGFTSEKFVNIIKKNLIKEHLFIKREFSKRFTKEQIRKAFFSVTTEEEAYVQYLSSDNMIIMLVYGKNCYKKTREMKKKIRKQFGLNHMDMRNILHSSDDGIEFYLQYSICEELYDLELDMKGYANLYILDESMLAMKKYEKHAFISDSPKQLAEIKGLFDVYGFQSSITLSTGKNFSIVNYVKNKDIEKRERALKVVIYSKELYIKENLYELNQFGVCGVLMNDEKICIKDAELIYDILELYFPNWIVIGGGVHISIGERSYRKFLSTLLRI